MLDYSLAECAHTNTEHIKASVKTLDDKTVTKAAAAHTEEPNLPLRPMQQCRCTYSWVSGQLPTSGSDSLTTTRNDYKRQRDAVTPDKQRCTPINKNIIRCSNSSANIQYVLSCISIFKKRERTTVKAIDNVYLTWTVSEFVFIPATMLSKRYNTLPNLFQKMFVHLYCQIQQCCLEGVVSS